ncbi:aldo/keto reductase [Salinicoccus hispanicus]|uniref:Aldo/keto reductase n=1 Tax=Salinicoccus hispanicus TaxID=157225 RepID=A0A6N8TWF8_9STAP|nr:aldo/keto reductase [Salinicoccus hispanicus]MXQ50244.1 aldo/keto reductase [Salinicoccus hispanicus]
MKNIQLKDGINLSELSLGCMNLPLGDSNETKRIIGRALEAGITHFDTADLYQFGENEKAVGEALEKFRGDYNFTIGTKAGNEFDAARQEKIGWNPSASHIKEAVKQSLSRLGVEEIDLYQLHGGTIEDNKDETIGAFEDLKQEGLIRSYGISSIRPNVIDYYMEHSSISTLMMQFNPIDNRPLEILDSLNSDVTVLARGPVMKGLLSDNADKVLENKFADGVLEYSHPELHQTIRSLREVHSDLTALSYAFLHHHNAVVVNGVSSLSQLESNIDSYNRMPELSQDDLDKIMDAVKLMKYEAHRK